MDSPASAATPLRVLVVGTATRECAATCCVAALRSMGHDARAFDPDVHPAAIGHVRRSWPANRILNPLLAASGLLDKLHQDALLRAARNLQPDLILVIPLHQVDRTTIEALRKATRARIAGWFQDSFVNFLRHDFLRAPYDGLFFKDPYIVARLRDHGDMQNVHLLPEACEPTFHHSLELSSEDRRKYGCDLMVYGNLYAFRTLILERVLDYDLRVYGARPPRWLESPVRNRWEGFEVYGDEKIRAVLSAKIIVNSCHYGEVRSANARLFEVAGIGGFQVADAPGLSDYFEPGTEIATFKGPKQLRAVIDHYLARDDERAEMAARAQRRAFRDHTFAARLSKLLETIGLADRKGPAATRATTLP